MNLKVCDICKVDPRGLADVGDVRRVQISIERRSNDAPKDKTGSRSLDMCTTCVERLLGEAWKAAPLNTVENQLVVGVAIGGIPSEREQLIGVRPGRIQSPGNPRYWELQ